MCESVKGACEILGLDPLYVANEGRLAAFVRPGRPKSVAAMRTHPAAHDPRIVGKVTQEHAGTVVLRSPLGQRADRRYAFRRAIAANLLKKVYSYQFTVFVW